jgi:hypothetical protein
MNFVLKKVLSIFAISFFASFLASTGVCPRLPERGLDQSWQQALVEATDKGRVFGKDVIFTYGPLHQSATHQVSTNMFPFLVGRLIFGITWFSLVVLACLIGGVGAGIVLLLGIAVLNARSGWPEGQSDVMFYMLNFLLVIMGMLIFASPKKPPSAKISLLLVGLCGSAISPLVKLSFAAAALPAYASILFLAFIHLLEHRSLRNYIHMAALAFIPLVSVFFTWHLITGNGIKDFICFFTGPNTDIIKNYSISMSSSPMFGDGVLQVGLFLFSLFILYILCWHYILAERVIWNSYFSIIKFVSHLLILLVLSWVLLKVGFVRHETQAITAGLMCIGIWFIIISFSWNAIFNNLYGKNRVLIFSTLLTPVVAGFLIAIANGYFPSASKGTFQYILKFPETFYNIFTPQGHAFLQESRGWELKKLRSDSENFSKTQTLLGNADIIPWEITDLLTNNVDYSPRPIPQSYSVYSKRLQEINSNFFLSDQTAPDWVIVGIDDIDGRLPINLDSQSLRIIFSKYEFSHKASKGSLVFKRTKTKEANPIVQVEEDSLEWVKKGKLLYESSMIKVDKLNSFMWISFNFQPSLINQMISTVFKPFPTFIEYLDAEENVVYSARIIPDAVNDFLIYPPIKSTEELLNPVIDEIRSFRFAARCFGHPFVKSKYILEITEGPLFQLAQSTTKD